MSRSIQIELTNLCLVYQGDKILVQERTWNGQTGIIFPGGHVERGESIRDSVIREIQEETGLTIRHPKLCAIKNWVNDDGSRYMVILYKTDQFEGELRPSEEGRVFWTTREEFEHLPVMWNMREVLKAIDSDTITEIFWGIEDEDDQFRFLE